MENRSKWEYAMQHRRRTRRIGRIQFHEYRLDYVHIEPWSFEPDKFISEDQSKGAGGLTFSRTLALPPLANILLAKLNAEL
jgi:hypothetical protein